MADYQLVANSTSVLRVADGAFIPDDPANVDYQAFLAWVAAGHTPAPAPVPPPPTTITAAAFLARFTPTEQLAIQTAAGSNAQIALGLTMGLAAGAINLVGDPVVTNWMAGLVTAGCITDARRVAILTP